MEIVEGISSAIAAIVAIVAASIALRQFHRGQRDAEAARVAQLSWSIYLAYDSERMRTGRRYLETIARGSPLPTDAREFMAMYKTGTYTGPEEQRVRERAAQLRPHNVRPALRYYQQVSILMNKGLIDEDFIFPLIGAGLETAQDGIRIVVAYYQNFYIGESGNEEGPRRLVYQGATDLLDRYSRWRQAREQ